MNEGLKNWINSEILAHLTTVNEHLVKRAQPYALSADELANLTFAYSCRDIGIPVDLEGPTDKYGYGRLVGRTYHILRNPNLFLEGSAGGHRRLKLLYVIEHAFALKLHQIEDETSCLDDLLDLESAQDKRLSYCILDEDIYRRGRRKAQRRQGTNTLPDTESGMYTIPDTNVGGFDVIKSYDEEQGKRDALGEDYRDIEAKRAREEENERSKHDGILGHEPDIELNLGEYSREAYNPFRAGMLRRKHDAFYAALAIVTPGIDGTDNSLRTIGDLLASERDEALLALYQMMTT